MREKIGKRRERERGKEGGREGGRAQHSTTLGTADGHSFMWLFRKQPDQIRKGKPHFSAEAFVVRSKNNVCVFRH